MPPKKIKTKTAAAALPIPQNKDKAVEAIAKIGHHQRERQRIQAGMNDELSAIRQRYEAEALPHGEAITSLTQGLEVWAAANRDTLTQGGKTKTAQLASGLLSWRLRPPSVSIRGADKVLERLKTLGLGRFIRTKEEVSKELLLAEPEVAEQIQGIAITQREDFIVQPFETALEEVA